MENRFYHVAVNAGVPIALAYMDYAKRKQVLVKLFIHQVIIKRYDRDYGFYAEINAKFPEKFSIDQRYSPDQ